MNIINTDTRNRLIFWIPIIAGLVFLFLKIQAPVHQYTAYTPEFPNPNLPKTVFVIDKNLTKGAVYSFNTPADYQAAAPADYPKHTAGKFKLGKIYNDKTAGILVKYNGAFVAIKLQRVYDFSTHVSAEYYLQDSKHAQSQGKLRLNRVDSPAIANAKRRGRFVGDWYAGNQMWREQVINVHPRIYFVVTAVATILLLWKFDLDTARGYTRTFIAGWIIFAAIMMGLRYPLFVVLTSPYAVYNLWTLFRYRNA